ncbi:hypothetical protein BDQ12DRAFT_737731 [Crucibulum laeve]|uniref:Uncharacterized protein n=1 Tax=Crucibulum laeve TaxID=68775 RepID=A0A5C3M2B4_9AGAR|nr:hypothetical protein BDQ12DRAFT_737731 [Crucibulum laeve]
MPQFSDASKVNIEGSTFNDVAGDSNTLSVLQTIQGGTVTSAGRDTNMVINYNYNTSTSVEKTSTITWSEKMRLWWARRAPPAVTVADSALQPNPPNGLKYVNLTDPDKLDFNPDAYPVLKYGGYTYWALSFDDNRYAFAVLAFDDKGTMVKRFDKYGGRYIHRIEVDKDVVRFIGQGSKYVAMRLGDITVTL